METTKLNSTCHTSKRHLKGRISFALTFTYGGTFSFCCKRGTTIAIEGDTSHAIPLWGVWVAISLSFLILGWETGNQQITFPFVFCTFRGKHGEKLLSQVIKRSIVRWIFKGLNIRRHDSRVTWRWTKTYFILFIILQRQIKMLKTTNLLGKTND